MKAPAPLEKNVVNTNLNREFFSKLSDNVVPLFARRIVKLQSKAQTSVLGLGVDFVFPLSQHQEQEQEQEQLPPPKFIRRGCTRSLQIDYKLLMGFLLSLRGLGSEGQD